MKEPEINVGIVNALEIAFTLNAKFLAKGETVSGKQRVSFDEGGISWNGNVYRELTSPRWKTMPPSRSKT